VSSRLVCQRALELEVTALDFGWPMLKPVGLFLPSLYAPGS